MATVTSWTDTLTKFKEIAEPTPGDTVIYPFVGSEWVWLLIAVIFWLAWHFKTSAGETQEHDELASKGKAADDYKKNVAGW